MFSTLKYRNVFLTNHPPVAVSIKPHFNSNRWLNFRNCNVFHAKCSSYDHYDHDYHVAYNNDPWRSNFYLPVTRGILRHSRYLWARLLCVRLRIALHIGKPIANESSTKSFTRHFSRFSLILLDLSRGKHFRSSYFDMHCCESSFLQ